MSRCRTATGPESLTWGFTSLQRGPQLEASVPGELDVTVRARWVSIPDEVRIHGKK
jgi:hypothetical protein